MAVIPFRTHICLLYFSLLFPFRNFQFQIPMYPMAGMMPAMPAPAPMPMPVPVPVAAAPVMQPVVFTFRYTTTEKAPTALSFQVAFPMPMGLPPPAYCQMRPKAPDCAQPSPAPFAPYPMPYPQAMFAAIPQMPFSRMIPKKRGNFRRMLNNGNVDINLNGNGESDFGFSRPWNSMFKPFRISRSVHEDTLDANDAANNKSIFSNPENIDVMNSTEGFGENKREKFNSNRVKK